MIRHPPSTRGRIDLRLKVDDRLTQRLDVGQFGLSGVPLLRDVSERGSPMLGIDPQFGKTGALAQDEVVGTGEPTAKVVDPVYRLEIGGRHLDRERLVEVVNHDPHERGKESLAPCFISSPACLKGLSGVSEIHRPVEGDTVGLQDLLPISIESPPRPVCADEPG